MADEKNITEDKEPIKAETVKKQASEFAKGISVKLNKAKFFDHKSIAEKCKNIDIIKVKYDEEWAKKTLLAEFVNRRYHEKFIKSAKIVDCRLIYVANVKSIHISNSETKRTGTYTYDAGYDIVSNTQYYGTEILDIGSHTSSSSYTSWSSPRDFAGYEVPEGKSYEKSSVIPNTLVYLECGLKGLESSSTSPSFIGGQAHGTEFSSTYLSSSTHVDLIIYEPMYEICVDYDGINFCQYVSAYSGSVFTSGPLSERVRKKYARANRSLKISAYTKTLLYWLIGLIPAIALIYLNVFEWGSEFVATNRTIWATRQDWIMPIIEDSASVFFTPTILAILAFVWACLKLIFNLTPFLIPIIYCSIAINCGLDHGVKGENVDLNPVFIGTKVDLIAGKHKKIKAKIVIKNIIWLLSSLGVCVLEYIFLKWLIFSLYV